MKGNEQKNNEYEVNTLRTGLIQIGFKEGVTTKGSITFCNDQYYAKNCDEPVKLTFKIYKNSVAFVCVRKNGWKYEDYSRRPLFTKDGGTVFKDFNDFKNRFDTFIAFNVFHKHLTFDKFVNLIKNNGNFICYDEDEYYAENIYINEQITSAKIRIELLDDRAMIRWYYKQNASKRVDILYCKFSEDEVLSDILIEALNFILREFEFQKMPLECEECRPQCLSNNDM